MSQINNIFKFLKEYNQLTNPVVTEIEKQKWNLNLLELPMIDEIKSAFKSDDISNLEIIRVKKPVIKACPTPDESLREWIISDWKNIFVEKINHNKKIDSEAIVDEYDVEFEKFEDDNTRVTLYNDWIAKRKKWRFEEIPKKNGLDLYNKIFGLYSDMKKEMESVELIVGDGFIKWKVDDRTVKHPILLQKVKLVFKPEIPMFILKCEESNTTLYSALIRVLPSVNQKMLTTIIKEIENENYDLVDIENTKSLYKRIVHIIDKNGNFLEDTLSISEHATIYHNPILFLRKRTLGYSEFLENIISELDNADKSDIPEFFGPMTGKHEVEINDNSTEDNWNYNGIDEDILLTLPANNEQLRIIKFLEKYGAVLVQGPPGTGKTHTIANLIGHLLSKGNNILVTSHTEKALKVLKKMVFKDPNDNNLNLQNLCISLMSTKSQKKEMDKAINEIASRGTTFNIPKAKIEIKQLKSQRKKMTNDIKEKNKTLLRIRALEYKDIVFDNQTIKPIDAAKFIKDEKDCADIIPGITTNYEVGFPLSDDELEYLYKSNIGISIYEEELLENELPNTDNIWIPKRFNNHVDALNNSKKLTNDYSFSIKFGRDFDYEETKDIINILDNIIKSIESFSSLDKYIINKIIQYPIYRSLWNEILDTYDKFVLDSDSVKKVHYKHEFSFSDDLVTDNNLDLLSQIIDTKRDKPITILHSIIKPKWVKLQKLILNNDKPIETLEEFNGIFDIISYRLDKKKLVDRINKLLQEYKISLSYDDPSLEFKAKEYRNKIDYVLDWYSSEWQPFFKDLEEKYDIDEEWMRNNTIGLSDPLEWINVLIKDYIKPDICCMKEIIEGEKSRNEIQEYIGYLNSFENNSTYYHNFMMSINKNDHNQYKTNFNIIMSVLQKRSDVKERKRIIAKINRIAPEWASKLKARKGIHGKNEIPRNIKKAWKWTQLNNQLNYIDNIDINKVHKEINGLNKHIIKNSQELAYRKAWLKKISNQSPVEMQAIEGWRTTIRQVGKGMGKRAPILLKKARELMPLCQSAIPVWIMPMNRVVESFNPIRNKFDVVIIDEASQSNILSLVALYLGKKVIIVGDDEQVSPSSVGIKSEEVNALIEMYLEDIPNNHLFNGQTSLYDLAKSSGFKPLMLTEHFRCLPEIIQFSNALSYNGKIRPLRDSSSTEIKPPVINYRVTEGTRGENKVNQSEAYHIASLVCSMIDNPAYQDKTIGIISMLGHQQSSEIQQLLQMHLDPVKYETHKIQCGNPSQFQGDERDIIILSLVDSPNLEGGPIRLVSADGRNDMYRKRYNVATSRAKDQLWVVHSLNPEIDLKPDDIRLRLIKYAKNPYNFNENKLIHAESPFEESVMESLLNSGYKVTPQLKVGSYRIDMVVEDGSNRIAIECDGEKYHTINNLEDDLKRQAILERLGWRFIRIRGSVYYRNPKKTMNHVMEQLKKEGVSPNYRGEENDKDFNDDKELKILNQVKIKAANYRNQWNENSKITEDHKKKKKTNSKKNGNNDHSNSKSKDNSNTELPMDSLLKINKNNKKSHPIEVKNSKERIKRNVASAQTNSTESSKKKSIEANETESKSSANSPTFDFRQKIEKDLIKAKKVINKENDNNKNSENSKITNVKDINKPLFDFRK